jgi:hypothetical protein
VPPEDKTSVDAKNAELQKAEQELVEAKKAADLDRQKQAAIQKAAGTKKAEPLVNDAAFEAHRVANLEREKRAKIDVANKRSAFALTQELAAIEKEYAEARKPVSAAGRCPRCNSNETLVGPEGKTCNSCGNQWV